MLDEIKRSFALVCTAMQTEPARASVLLGRPALPAHGAGRLEHAADILATAAANPSTADHADLRLLRFFFSSALSCAALAASGLSLPPSISDQKWSSKYACRVTPPERRDSIDALSLGASMTDGSPAAALRRLWQFAMFTSASSGRDPT